MIINEIKFKNLRSFGNKIQSLTFTNTPQIIFIQATNGEGKTTIQYAIDLVLYNHVVNHKGGKIPLNKLVNRYNKNLYLSIDYNNNNNDNVVIEKGYEPKLLKISVNEQDQTERIQHLTTEQMIKFIGYDYNTYKSFISINMQEFEGFINLPISGKKSLLYRICDLNKIEQYTEVATDLKNENSILIRNFKNDIYKLNTDITSISAKITSIEDKNKLNISNRVLELKNLHETNLATYKEHTSELQILTDRLNDIGKSVSTLTEQKESNQSKLINCQNKINFIKDKLVHFQEGICPICESNLKSKSFEPKIKEYNDIISQLLSEISACNNDSINAQILAYNNQKNEISKRIETLNKCIINVENTLKSISIENQNLKNVKKELVNDNSSELIKLLNEKKSEVSKLNVEMNIVSKNNDLLDKLLLIFKDEHITNIIANKILTPVNNYISTYIKMLDLKFKVILDSEFNVKVFVNNLIEVDIDNELSKGEVRMINIIVALSYLSAILDKNHCNILFMDELFESLNMENIEKILVILKSISEKYNLNVLLIHHSLAYSNFKFDKIIRLSKNGVYSDIES